MDKSVLGIDELLKDIFTKSGDTDIIDKGIPRKSNLNILLDDLKPETRSVYLTHIRKFKRFVGRSSYDKWDVKRYINHLRGKGFSSSTINTCWFALKLLFEAEDIPWDMRRRDKPKLESNEFNVPVMPVEDIRKLIGYVRKRGVLDEKVIIALSTTYGLRRAEIAGIRNEDIDEDTLFIRTKKHGRQRMHLVPEEIRFIADFDFGKMPATSTLSFKFNSLCKRAGIKREYRQGFHSIRHSLNIELAGTGIPPLRIADFMRWERKDLGELPRYSRAKRSGFKQIDREIFSQHPFLPEWR